MNIRGHTRLFLHFGYTLRNDIDKFVLDEFRSYHLVFHSMCYHVNLYFTQVVCVCAFQFLHVMRPVTMGCGEEQPLSSKCLLSPKGSSAIAASFI